MKKGAGDNRPLFIYWLNFALVCAPPAEYPRRLAPPLSLHLPSAYFSFYEGVGDDVLGDGDRVPNQTSYEAVSPLLITCPHCCLASFVFLSTHIYNSGEAG